MTAVLLIFAVIIYLYISICSPAPVIIPTIQLTGLNGLTSSKSSNAENPRGVKRTTKCSWKNKTIGGLRRKIGTILTKVQKSNKKNDDVPWRADDDSDRGRRIRRLKFWSRVIRIYGYRIHRMKFSSFLNKRFL